MPAYALQGVNALQDANALQAVNAVQVQLEERAGQRTFSVQRAGACRRCLREALGLWPPLEMAVRPGLASGSSVD